MSSLLSRFGNLARVK
jgi:hypothetical protein